MLTFDIITLFPEVITPYLEASIIGRAQKTKYARFAVHQLREHATDRRHTVDDSPFGGGAGMILKLEPIWKCVQFLRSKIKKQKSKTKVKILLMSAKGKPFTQQLAQKYSKLDHIVIICGRYEGVDERVKEHIADEELSVGPYVLTGGELPALTIVDAVTRLLPGVLGNNESLAEESYSVQAHHEKSETHSTAKEYPHYTRPEVFVPKKGVRWRVPKVLLSGDHKKVAEWRTTHES